MFIKIVSDTYNQQDVSIVLDISDSDIYGSLQPIVNSLVELSTHNGAVIHAPFKVRDHQQTTISDGANILPCLLALSSTQKHGFDTVQLDDNVRLGLLKLAQANQQFLDAKHAPIGSLIGVRPDVVANAIRKHHSSAGWRLNAILRFCDAALPITVNGESISFIVANVVDGVKCACGSAIERNMLSIHTRTWDCAIASTTNAAKDAGFTRIEDPKTAYAVIKALNVETRLVPERLSVYVPTWVTAAIDSYHKSDGFGGMTLTEYIDKMASTMDPIK